MLRRRDPDGQPLTDQELTRIDAYRPAVNYLSAGQVSLLDNPLLREPLRIEYVKEAFRDRLIEHRRRIVESGEGPPEIRDWHWGTPRGPSGDPAGHAARRRGGECRAMANLGEHSGGIRAATTGRLHHLALDLDSDANASAEADAHVATLPERTRTLVVTTREDLAVLAEVERLLVGS